MTTTTIHPVLALRDTGFYDKLGDMKALPDMSDDHPTLLLLHHDAQGAMLALEWLNLHRRTVGAMVSFRPGERAENLTARLDGKTLRETLLGRVAVLGSTAVTCVLYWANMGLSYATSRGGECPLPLLARNGIYSKLQGDHAMEATLVHADFPYSVLVHYGTRMECLGYNFIQTDGAGRVRRLVSQLAQEPGLVENLHAASQSQPMADAVRECMAAWGTAHMTCQRFVPKLGRAFAMEVPEGEYIPAYRMTLEDMVAARYRPTEALLNG
jgi:hypothetical protein